MKAAVTLLLLVSTLTACGTERDEGTQASSAGSRAGRTGNMPPYPDVATERGRGVLGTGGLGRSGDPQTYNDRGASGFYPFPIRTEPAPSEPNSEPMPDVQPPAPPSK